MLENKGAAESIDEILKNFSHLDILLLPALSEICNSSNESQSWLRLDRTSSNKFISNLVPVTIHGMSLISTDSNKIWVKT